MISPKVNIEGLASHNVKFVTWNVRGLGGQIKRSRVFSHLKSLSSDIVFFTGDSPQG